MKFYLKKKQLFKKTTQNGKESTKKSTTKKQLSETFDLSNERAKKQQQIEKNKNETNKFLSQFFVKIISKLVLIALRTFFSVKNCDFQSDESEQFDKFLKK